MMTKNQEPVTNRVDSPSIAQSKFVDRHEFMRLLVGNTQLERADDRAAHIRGLYDPKRHCRFVIEEEKLFAHYN